ncbi:MAG: SUMF1/EgtB/PvdO family nonheme iron enzyme [Myxococcales bacterium]|nr:SUMF1/EgtB/PvdO family nonheme iron enzyme [Myxococcales bacterium]
MVDLPALPGAQLLAHRSARLEGASGFSEPGCAWTPAGARDVRTEVRCPGVVAAGDACLDFGPARAWSASSCASGCAILRDGGVRCFVHLDEALLSHANADPRARERDRFVFDVEDSLDAVAISDGGASGLSCMVKGPDGTVHCWGGEREWRKVRGGLLRGPLPAFRVPDVTGAVAVAGTCASLAGGGVRCWAPPRPFAPVVGPATPVPGSSGQCVLEAGGVHCGAAALREPSDVVLVGDSHPGAPTCVAVSSGRVACFRVAPGSAEAPAPRWVRFAAAAEDRGADASVGSSARTWPDFVVRCGPGDTLHAGRCLPPMPSCPAHSLFDPRWGCVSDGSPPDAGVEMVRVPAGPFSMGAPSARRESAEDAPEHVVDVAAFEIDRTEVSVMAYERCVVAGRCAEPADAWDPACNWNLLRDSSLHDVDVHGVQRLWHPMNCLDWADAEQYCRWAGKRLPTEAEWEKAARGTDGRSWPWTRGADPGCSAWNACPLPEAPGRDVPAGLAKLPTTLPVHLAPAGKSPYGAFHMVGNVAEWVSDWYAPYPAAGTGRDPSGPVTGIERVHRGGAWGDGALPAFVRAHAPPDTARPTLGFRCARTP